MLDKRGSEAIAFVLEEDELYYTVCYKLRVHGDVRMLQTYMTNDDMRRDR